MTRKQKFHGGGSRCEFYETIRFITVVDDEDFPRDARAIRTREIFERGSRSTAIKQFPWELTERTTILGHQSRETRKLLLRRTSPLQRLRQEHGLGINLWSFVRVGCVACAYANSLKSIICYPSRRMNLTGNKHMRVTREQDRYLLYINPLEL